MSWILISEETPPPQRQLLFKEIDETVFIGFRIADRYHRMEDGMGVILDHAPEYWAEIE